MSGARSSEVPGTTERSLAAACCLRENTVMATTATRATTATQAQTMPIVAPSDSPLLLLRLLLLSL